MKCRNIWCDNHVPKTGTTNCHTYEIGIAPDNYIEYCKSRKRYNRMMKIIKNSSCEKTKIAIKKEHDRYYKKGE